MKRKEELLKIISGVPVKLWAAICMGIHIMVCWTFNGPSPSVENETADHINRIKTDNWHENLQWAGFQLQSLNQQKKVCIVDTVQIFGLDGAKNAKIMEVFIKLSNHYVKWPSAVNMLHQEDYVSDTEVSPNASMMVAQKVIV
jgi:hypothetical protein